MYLEKIKGKMACDAMSKMLLTKLNYNKHIKRLLSSFYDIYSEYFRILTIKSKILIIEECVVCNFE